LISAIVAIKQRNPRSGCPRIALIITNIFAVPVDRDAVRRVWARHYRPDPTLGGGPSWLSLIGHARDSLWSPDLFRRESIRLKTHWVLAVMDQFTRRIEVPRSCPVLECRRLGTEVERVHSTLDGKTPDQIAMGASSLLPAQLDRFDWMSHCRGLFQTPVAV
jgi:hypothetical protein